MQKQTLDSEDGLSGQELVPVLERMGLPAQLHTNPDLLIWSTIENHPFSIYFYNNSTLLSDQQAKAEVILLWAGMRPPLTEEALVKLSADITWQHLLVKADARGDLLNFKMALVAKGLKMSSLFHNLNHWAKSLKSIDRMIERHLPVQTKIS